MHFLFIAANIPVNSQAFIVVKGDTGLSVADAGFNFVSHFILSEKLN